MRTVSVSDLKDSVDECLNAVLDGEEVVVTDDGKPVVRMVKIRDAPACDARRARLIRQNILVPRKKPMGPLLPPPGDTPSGVLDALLAERAEGR